MKKYFSTYLSAVSVIALLLVSVINICQLTFGFSSTDTAGSANTSAMSINETTSNDSNETVSADETEHPEDLNMENIVSSDNSIDDSSSGENESNYFYLSDEDIRDFAALVFLEAGAGPEEVKYAVASVILNRMTLWNMSFTEVAYQKDQFTPASLINSTEARDVEINIVKDILKNGPTIDKYVCYFRADHYHKWKGMNNYNYFGGNVYFSYSDIDYDRYLG